MHISALWAEQRYPPGGKNEGEGRTAAPRFFSAALCPAGAPVAPVQYFFNLAPPVQDLPAEDIVWKRAVAPVLAQCPATDLQQACHFPVTQIFILFWQNPPVFGKAVDYHRQPVDALMNGLHPRIIPCLQFIIHDSSVLVTQSLSFRSPAPCSGLPCACPQLS